MVYDLPSAPLREVLGITNTDGYLFYNSKKQIKAANILMGENWRTEQKQLLVDSELLKKMEEMDKEIIWIMREYRRESGKSREKFGDFYAQKDNSYVGFYKGTEFIAMKITLREILNDNPKKENDDLEKLLSEQKYKL